MPGKFNNELDRLIYELTLDGGHDEECGSVDDIGYWAALIYDGDELADALDFDGSASRTPNQRYLADLRRSAGVILSEDDQGFVAVQMFDTKAQLEKEWKACQEDAATGYEEEELDDAGKGGYEEDDREYDE
jgi:hypothetical protein